MNEGHKYGYHVQNVNYMNEGEFSKGYLEGGLGLDLAVGNLFFTCTEKS